MIRNLILPAAFCLLCSNAGLRAVTILGVDRAGEFQPEGTLLRYDTEFPSAGVVVGQTGIAEVGAIDFFQNRLWAASSDGGVLSFWQIDPETAQASRISTAGRFSAGGYVFGGSFDDQGRFWVTDLVLDTLASYDPWTGQRLSVVSIQSDLTIPGLAFVGPDLYAIARPSGGAGQLGRLDTNTGAFQAIYGFPVGGSNGLDYDPVGGKLYSTYPSSNPGASSRLYAFDLSAGQLTTSYLDPHATMDAIAVLPEPAGLLFLALAGVVARRR